MSERTFKPVDAYVEAAPDEGLIVLCRLGAPNLPRNDYYIAEHDEVTIYPGHEERLTEAEWQERAAGPGGVDRDLRTFADEDAALLALCERVAAKECGGDE